MARAAVPVIPESADDQKARPTGGRGAKPRKLGGPYGASFTGDGAKGLRFERRWTRPGVHPYDEITWEQRTASIASETGRTVFEQTDVEVPSFWSQLATNVVVSKYFRGHVGTPQRERSVKQLIDRVVNTIAAWAETQRYFASDEDLATFKAELAHLLVHQKMSFNSPVWFNVGIEERPQCSACFINSVQDSMSSIMDLAKTEAMLFKFGSGAGSNLSPIRSSRERMSGGGMASGPVSFMKGYDAFAGVIKSGGKTRRAAKMVILDVDHPDILDFVDSKLLEEKKAWALIEQGYDASFTGEAYGSIFFQNANHSVRVTDEFMQAVLEDRDWTTHAVVDDAPVDTLKAREIFRRMADAAWVCGDPGIQYDSTVNDWHTSANTDRIYASNPCSEYMFLNDTACNLASLNLMKYVRDDGEFDVEGYRYAARLTITAQEILVDNASYPTPRIEENSHKFRPLGLGYANLGALLMSRGLAYDSDEGRNFAAALTAVMHGEAYKQSAIVARDHGGPFLMYDENRAPFLRVINKHRDAAYQIPAPGVPQDLGDAARAAFDEARQLGEKHGYRNAQVTVLAPTGTIAFMMDCDTTGIEPDIALIKYKKLVGEGFLKIVNNTVPAALRKLGYSPDEVEAIVAHVNERETIEGAPGLRPEHLPVFDCAFKPVNGDRSIHYMGHVRMMAAVQPFLSGAISKTVNMPEAATAEEIERVYLEGWKLGLKAIAIYRDNSKRSQPLSTGKKQDDQGAVEDDAAVAELRAQLTAAQAEATRPHRHRLPSERTAITHKFEISGHEGYITVGLYPDGQPGEIFLKMAKEGSTVSGLMDSLATTISVALQYGVPLKDLVNKFAHVRFEPSGFTGNPEIPIAKSIVDYIFRWLGSRFLTDEDRANLGLIDRSAIVADAPSPFSFGASALVPRAEEGPSAIEEATSGPASSGASGATGTAGPSPAAESPAAELPADEPPTATATAGPADAAAEDAPAPELQVIATNGHANGHGKASNGSAQTGGITLDLGGGKVGFQQQADAPSCAECGSIMVRNGSCYKCLNCGSTSGCS
jgi:ribonucleoside-diphosphate reductase alpha chain